MGRYRYGQCPGSDPTPLAATHIRSPAMGIGGMKREVPEIARAASAPPSLTSEPELSMPAWALTVWSPPTVSRYGH